MRIYDREGKLARKMFWSGSFYECANKEDFAHLVLQQYLSQKADTHFLNDEQAERSERTKPSSWAEYTNRASIMSYFTYDEESYLNEDPASSEIVV